MKNSKLPVSQQLADQLPLFPKESSSLAPSKPNDLEEIVENQINNLSFKQTELGLLPKNWEVKQLDQLANVERGKFTARPRNDPKFFGGDIPFIQTGDVTSSNGKITNYSQTLNLEGVKVSKVFPKGTLLFTIAANIGDVGFTTFDTACPDSLVAIVTDKKVNRIWLYYELSKRKSLFEKIATHNAQLNINLEKLRPYLLPVPPLQEQRAIAEALSDVDALLDSLDRLIAKKRDIKQAAMQQLLTGKTRLPGFSGEWEEKLLADCLLTNPDYGINAPAVPQSDQLPTYLRITDINDDGLFCPNPRMSVEVSTTKDYFLRDGDVVFARTGASVGKSYLFNIEDGELVFAGFLIRVKPDPKILLPSFLAFYSHSEPYWCWVRLMSMRSGQPGINGNEYSQLPLYLPPVNEQIAIVEVLSEMNATITALTRQREKTRAIKQGMMQELLTGRTRLV